MRIFLPTYFLVTMLLVFVIRVVVVKRRTGVNPVVEKWRDDLRGYVGRGLVVAELLVAVDVAFVALGRPALAYLAPIAPLEHPIAQAAGVTLLLFALAWIVLAQLQMGDSWRIGVDPDAKTALVTRGLFSRSRNPVFLGMRASLLGLFLAAPNALSLAAAVLGEVLVQVQVRVEEAYLEGVHGAAYQSYRRGVRRWI